MNCSLETAALQLISVLNLETPPIAMALVDHKPVEIAAAIGTSPSACRFWRDAETRLFYASAEQHLGCPVGAMVMGFELPEFAKEDLERAVGQMIKCGYLGKDEPSRIPTMRGRAAGVVYGPLAQFTLQPDAVIVWLKARQAMLLNEAVGSCSWTESAPMSVYGRPACAAIPLATEKGAALSFGCAGMRTFTKVPDDRMLAVIPGDRVEDVASSLARVSAANDAMQSFYNNRLTAL